MRHTTLIAAAAILVMGMGLPDHAYSQNFSEKFELKPFWTIHELNGSVGLSTDVRHAGRMSLKLTSRAGGQRNVWLAHKYDLPRKGTISVWFYDGSPGVANLYSGLYAVNSADGSQHFAVNVADWSPSQYVWNGPGISETMTSVTRTAGWHEFTLRLTATGFDALIDGAVVGTVAGDFQFDTLYLLLQGPGSAPNATFYFDDFKFRALP